MKKKKKTLKQLTAEYNAASDAYDKLLLAVKNVTETRAMRVQANDAYTKIQQAKEKLEDERRRLRHAKKK